MTKDHQIAIRFESDIAERAEELAEKLGPLPEFRAFRMSRAAVLRMALDEGLKVLEEKYRELLKAGATSAKRKKG